MKPHYRLRYFVFDGKTPLWWVSRAVRSPFPALLHAKTTGGFTNSGDAVRAAARI